MILKRAIDCFIINKENIYIHTSARFCLNIINDIENRIDDSELWELYISCIDFEKTNADVVFNWSDYEKCNYVKYIQEFLYCNHGKSNNTYKPKKQTVNKVIDYEIDSNRIFSAFYKTYKIDIESMLDYLHFHKYRAMESDLDECTLTHAMKFRSYDKTRKEYKDGTKEFKSYVDEQIALYRFENESDVVLEESPLAKRRRIARESL